MSDSALGRAKKRKRRRGGGKHSRKRLPVGTIRLKKRERGEARYIKVRLDGPIGRRRPRSQPRRRDAASVVLKAPDSKSGGKEVFL